MKNNDRWIQGRQIILEEARALEGLVERLDKDAFGRAIDLILQTKGRVVVSGMGKAGLVAMKISATMASTGTPSLYLHPADAVHGDLGRVLGEDVVIILSNSGETEEITRLLDPVKRIGAKIIAITGNPGSTLAMFADTVLDIGNIVEAGESFAPTASTTAMMALGDAIALVVQKERNFAPEDIVKFHPGGYLGRSLLKVKEIMRSGEKNPVTLAGTPVKDVVIIMTTTPGRPGAATIVNGEGRLVGIFTDGDLRRKLIEGVPNLLERKIDDVMTLEPKYVHQEMLVSEAHRVLIEHRVDQVPVVDDDLKAVGMLDVQDILDFRTP